MGEKPEDFEGLSEPGSAPGPAASAAAWATLGAASREKADAFLAEQTTLTRQQSALVQLQTQELRDEIELHHWSMRIRHISDLIRLTFQTAGALFVLGLVLFIGAALWNAAHNDGVVIEAFAVPPDLAARGLSGQVIATQIQDRLSWLQAHTDSGRPAGTYTNNWGDNDIKVQIPDTGVSIGELYRYLASTLGHQTEITGEVWHTGDGISLSARAGAASAKTFTGNESDLSALIEKAAEHVYCETQAYRCAVFLYISGRKDDAHQVIEKLVSDGAPADRTWANLMLADEQGDNGDVKGSMATLHKIIGLDPNFMIAFFALSGGEASLGHDEAALKDAQRATEIAGTHANSELIVIGGLAAANFTADSLGDYAAGIAQEKAVQGIPEHLHSHALAPAIIAEELAKSHDVSGSLEAQGPDPDGDLANYAFLINEVTISLVSPLPALQRAIALDDWQAAHNDIVAFDNDPRSKNVAFAPGVPATIWPWEALADAKTGDFASAHRLIDQTPEDCYLCARVRARIFAAEKNWPQAERWLAQAVRLAPSLPSAYLEWGQMLAAKGDAAGAIAKFQLAAQKGPHFADPLEAWGEALLAQKQYAQAEAKFSAAEKYAPRWGRLHLEWGEALAASGHADDAQKQYALARTLDLSAADKRELPSP